MQRLLLAFLLFPFAATSQVRDPLLKATIDSIGEADQRYRALITDMTPAQSDSLVRLWRVPADSLQPVLIRLQDALDATNLSAIEDLIRKRGYPGKSLVGASSGTVAFYVLQHSPKIAAYLPMLRKESAKGELPGTLVAMMEDRLLVQEEKEQVYGTQLWGNPVKDSITGVTKPFFYFNPIRDPKKVNRRRKVAGFDSTIEEYAAEMGMPYRVKRPWWWKDRPANPEAGSRHQ